MSLIDQAILGSTDFGGGILHGIYAFVSQIRLLLGLL